jgi:hypothetical protein
MNEEPFLEKEFGDDYLDFKREVPRWRIRLTPAAPRGREQVFTWAMFRLNRELPRAASHLILLLIFTFYFFTANPWIGIDPEVRATLVGCIAVWLVLRDIIPLDVSRMHVGWLWLAVAIVIAGAAWLAFAPLWEPWSVAASWGALIAGILLGLIVSLPSLPAVAGASGKNLGDLLAQPMSQWYVVGLGLGLLTLKMGGVWIGILAPLCLWALGLAGMVPMRPIPLSNAAAFGLLAAFSLFAASAVTRLLV